jgi:hypothetical protein
MAAAKAVQTIHTDEVIYQSQYGRFATSLRELGPPDAGPSSAAAAGLISAALAGGTAGGLQIRSPWQPRQLRSLRLVVNLWLDRSPILFSGPNRNPSRQ